MVSDNLLIHESDDTIKLPYTVYTGKAEKTGDVFKTASYTAAGEKTDLAVGITQEDWDSSYAGKYTGSVIFRIEYTNS